MANTTYTNFTTPAIDAGWLNDVNNLVYNLAGDGVNAPANDSDVRTNLGLGTMATQNANAVTITGGSVSGITDLSIADGGTGASTAAAARTNLNVAQIGPVFSAMLSASQALPDAAFAVVIFNSEDFDSDSYYDNTTGRFTPLVAGYYQINAAVTVEANGSTLSNAAVALFKNGTEFHRGPFLTTSAANISAFAGQVSIVVFFNGTTDFVDIRAFGDVAAGTPRALGGGVNPTRISGHFIRP